MNTFQLFTVNRSHFSSLSANLFKGILFSYSQGFSLFLRIICSSEKTRKILFGKGFFFLTPPKDYSVTFSENISKICSCLCLLSRLPLFLAVGTQYKDGPGLLHVNELPHVLVPWCCLSFFTQEAKSSVPLEIGMIIELITQIGTLEKKRTASETGSVKIDVNRAVWSHYLRAV